ncbi:MULTISPECIES: SPOR domain-containing protein [unclassified Halomonas]|uniref:SPOR domain-containing protein n=1 Tax=unclassified Halomonas TaxID=2609666 RepID=UPI0006DB6D2B|nr:MULTISPECIES: SPOR domain-containing protein [unclassified Halomonas]KPQ21149.1 MAG: cell division protein FtsN [Halomonas sp. HL-93]SBR46350.1 Sporulation related domain-containing protein [Halomonas sp. HL-93]SNY98713.1 Sporulation related domain-containing protein [Halomonas sp. hl-4]
MASPRKKPARRGATSQRKAARRSSGGFRLPGWLWALAGVAAGFFLAQHQHGTAPWQDTPDDNAQTTSDSTAEEREAREAARETESSSESSMPTFEFYTLLPETEVIAPGVTPPSSVEQPAAAEADADASNRDDDTVDDPIAQVIAANMRPEEQVTTAQQAANEEDARYVLQAASFRELDDAEQLQQRLRNLSLLAQISEIQADGSTWHRVQVGPYDDTRELNRAQDLMTTQGIEPLLIQLQN